MTQRRIVIIGGGIAGLELATMLSRPRTMRRAFAVTLIDRSLGHVWKPMLHEFAAGTARRGQDRIDFFPEAARRGYVFMPGTLARVDRETRSVTLEALLDAGGSVILPRRTVNYHALVVATGSRANDFGITGVLDHCHFIDSLNEADAFNVRFRDLMLKSMAEGSPVRVGIVGGGATGVELAAELHRAVDLIASITAGAGRKLLDVTLVETGDRLLSAFPASVSHDAERQLVGLGIKVRTQSEVTVADKGGFTLKDGSRIETNINVWAAGVKASSATSAFEGLEQSRSGQLLVNDRLQTPADPAVFCLGDSSRLVSSPVPATAQAARQQALYLAKALPQILEGREASPFRYRDKGSIVSLGDYNGWGTLGKYFVFGGGRLRGLSARLTHDWLYRQHQVEIYGLWRGVAAFLSEKLDGIVRPPLTLD